MKKMKRLFAGLLAVVMLAMATPVYAAPIKAEDAIIDLSQEEIIDLLGGLDIIEGYEDGEFHGERNVTRAEMATIVVKTLKLDAAPALEIFDDVALTHWANGYIARAYAEGIIVGDGNGMFRPEDTVTYAEVYTMFVNVLNYQPKKDLAWPANYVTVARANGIADGIMAYDTVAATRNDIAKIVWNVLNTEIMEIYTIGDIETYRPSGKTLLDNKFDEVEYLEEVKFKGYKITNKETKDFEVKIALNNKTAKYVYTENDFYTIPNNTLVNALIINDTVVSMSLAEDYEIIKGNAVEINAEEYEDLEKIDAKYYVYMTLVDGEYDKDIKAIEANEVINSAVIEKVNFNKASKKVTFIDGTTLSIHEDKLGSTMFIIDGKRATIEKLEVGDVVTKINDKLYEVSRNSIEGDFEELTSERVAKGYTYDTIAIDGVEYRYTVDTKWYDEDYNEINKKDLAEETEVTVYLTNNNEVVAVVAADAVETYGIIEDIDEGVIYLADGTEYDYAKKNGAKAKDAIIYHFEKGEIVVDKAYSVEDAEKAETVVTKVNKDNIITTPYGKYTKTDISSLLEEEEYKIYLIEIDVEDKEFDDIIKVEEKKIVPSFFEVNDRIEIEDNYIVIVRGF